MNPNKFNIRVYGIVIKENKILLLNEPFRKQMIYKLPGGGLEFGEGLIDCLHREFKEELNLNIKSAEHFYTQDYYQASAIKPEEQLLMIYFTVEVKDLGAMKLLDKSIKSANFYTINAELLDKLSLETDKIVSKKLLNE